MSKPMSKNDRQVLLEYYREKLDAARKDLSKPIKSHKLDTGMKAAVIGAKYKEKQMKIAGLEAEIEKLK